MLKILAEAAKPRASVTLVARKHEVNANLVIAWRELQRRRLLEERAGPKLEAMHARLHWTFPQLSKKGELAVAIPYALTRWVALTRYCHDWRVEIDNNAAERSLSAIALGRKNWLLAGSDDGGKRAAALYNLVGTAQLKGLNAESYPRHVLQRLPEHPINCVEALLP